MNEIEDFFNSIGLKVAKQWRGEFSVYCPWHPDSNASLYVNPVKGLYHCFAGCVKGSKGLGPLLKKNKTPSFDIDQFIFTIFHLLFSNTLV